MVNFGDYLRDFIFPLLLGILVGRLREARLYDHTVQKVLSSTNVPPEKLLDLLGLPRCKNLWSFLCFAPFCVDFFGSFTLRNSWVSQVLSPRMSRYDLPRQVKLEREATGAGETLTFDVTSTSSYKVIDVNTLIDLKVSVDSFEFYL